MGGVIQTSGKYLDYSIEEIKEYLEELKRLISNNQYTISRRDENDAFAFEYRIDSAKGIEILLNLQYCDFCYAATNYKPEYAHERLFVFCKEYELDHWGNYEMVEIYIKTNLTQMKNGNDYIIVISFHKLNNPIKYLFR